MDYKEIRKQHIKPVLKLLLDNWLDIFFVIVLLIFLLIITFVGFNKMITATEIQKMFLTVDLIVIWVVIPIFYDEV